MAHGDGTPLEDASGAVTDEQIEKLAEAAHAIYCEGLRARGYVWGAIGDESRRVSAALVPFGHLSEYGKEQNRAFARDLLQKLAGAGYEIVADEGSATPLDLAGDALEKLAKEEHERWVARKRAEGWSYGPETDEAQKRHPALVPWEALEPSEKDKDRDLIRGIPQILARAGLRARART